MSPQTLFARFRTDIADFVKPYLWTDNEVWDYMGDAYRQFARFTGGISDSTNSLTVLSVKQGDVWADIDPRILKIRHAQKLSNNNEELTLVNFEDTMIMGKCDDYGTPRYFRLTLDQGPLQYLVEGMERSKVRFVPIPDRDETVNMIVYRLPLDAISPEEQPDEFEIEEQHHLSLLYWMKALAYKKQDAETFDKSKAEEFEEKFKMYCSEAEHERELREHKYRLVGYGGI